ncbi:LPD28 domain-containing protein [Anaerovibrio lipolyticus]|uniref:LPD28 domain-containing protein n=1 Tax=Anaerovibrio lipolyticus TaxID=82374 RepID=UPI00068C688E|nr:LPD28 domain-containing protein [Anaerovibrio lipolyticus]
MAIQSFEEALQHDNQSYALIIDGKEYIGHFANSSIDRKTLPPGWFAYDIRHDDEGLGEPVEVTNDYIKVKHLGTFYTTEPLPLSIGESLYFKDGNIDYNFSPDIPEHEPWNGKLPIEFVEGNCFNGDFYIAHGRTDYNLRGGIDGTIIKYDEDNYYTMELYVPVEYFDKVPDYAAKSDGGSITVNVKTGANWEQMEVYRLPPQAIELDDLKRMHKFEIEDFILRRSKDVFYEHSPEAFKKMFPEEYKSRRLDEFAKSGDWVLDYYDNILELKEYNHNDYATSGTNFKLGSVSFGNDIFYLYATTESRGFSVEYIHHTPLKEYESVQDREQQFNFELTKENLDAIYHVNSVQNQVSKIQLDVDVFDGDCSKFKQIICNMLIDDQRISLDKAPGYKEILDHEAGFTRQLNSAIREYYQKIFSKDKLNSEDISFLAKHYDSIVYFNEPYIGKKDIVKFMTEDGLSVKSIKSIGEEMDLFSGSVGISEVLKTPEIKSLLKEKVRSIDNWVR